MTGICIELKTSCGHCSSPLMLNAVTNDFICPACNKNNYFSDEDWQNLLDDAVKEGPGLNDGEGQPSTIMRGAYTYQLMYGKQQPRCGKCKTKIDVNKLEDYSAKSNYSCPKCSNEIFIRRTNDILQKEFSGIKFLVGEDDDMLKVNPVKGKLPSSAKPVLFTCPSCAGNLEIDGTDRMVSCKYCDSQIYLPDDLWLRLHPVKEVSRWYMVIDENALPAKGTMPEWYYLSDVLSDREGNTYFATADDGEGDFIVWSIDKELNTRWIKKGLKFSHERTGMCISDDGNLFLFNENRNSILKLSPKDGSEIKKDRR
ncbi:MAG: DNA-directed RNA polymerase subunit P [Chlorobi bacterium OLB5]|nr:MAG: DNA-directed RNA polymerase subunit P [Chlorobi bacterium OLB5]